MRQLILLLIYFIPFVVSAQTAEEILKGVTSKTDKVHDYSASVVIRSDIPLIKILPVRAKVYFKQKDKFRIISKSIAVLPKQGLSDLTKLLSNPGSYTAILNGTETIRNRKASIVILLPVSDTSDLTLAKLWVDTERNLILKSQITTRSNGTLLLEYTYTDQEQYGLPDSMIVTVDVKKFKVPKGVATDINKNSQDDNTPAKKSGKIFIRFSEYVINKGIADSVFEGK
ncbi:MAG: hypothetical protein U0X76_05290 [Bacteroidia bacterium]